MNISLNWLKYYVDIDVPVQELCDKMVMAGFEVESIVDLSQTMKNVVAGKIVKIEKHPDADKLVVCQVDAGGEAPIQIVTGASNLTAGDKVPVALDGSTLVNGTKIKKGKLRGVESCGMICAADMPNGDVKVIFPDESLPVGSKIR